MHKSAEKLISECRTRQRKLIFQHFHAHVKKGTTVPKISKFLFVLRKNLKKTEKAAQQNDEVKEWSKMIYFPANLA